MQCIVTFLGIACALLNNMNENLTLITRVTVGQLHSNSADSLLNIHHVTEQSHNTLLAEALRRPGIPT